MKRIKIDKTRRCLSVDFVVIMLVLVFTYSLVCVVRTVQYVPDVYVCRHMGRDLEIFLNSFNIDTKVVVGESMLVDGRHMWVVVNVLGFYVDVDSVYFYPFVNRFVHSDIEVFDSYLDYELSKNKKKMELKL